MPSAAWVGCGALALKDGVGAISGLPGGLFRRKIGDRWAISFNGTAREIDKSDDHPKLPPFGVYVEYNGWPAGILDPSGGIIAAGDAANEETFIAAIEADLGVGIEAFFAQR